jgi:hypothetical protein
MLCGLNGQELGSLLNLLPHLSSYKGTDLINVSVSPSLCTMNLCDWSLHP